MILFEEASGGFTFEEALYKRHPEARGHREGLSFRIRSEIILMGKKSNHWSEEDKNVSSFMPILQQIIQGPGKRAAALDVWRRDFMWNDEPDTLHYQNLVLFVLYDVYSTEDHRFRTDLSLQESFDLITDYIVADYNTCHKKGAEGFGQARRLVC